MQLTIAINQAAALDWGLNAQQALLFAFVYEVPSWANPLETKDGIFYALSKQKITEELPILTDKPDTAYRLLKQLEKAGLVELSSTSKITLVRTTEKAKAWNKKADVSAIRKASKEGRKNIRADHGKKSEVGKKSDVGRKNIRAEVGKISEVRSEKNPTNQYTSNQSTNNQDTSNTLAQAADAPKKRTSAFGLNDLLTNNPHGVSEQVLSDWLDCRKALRAPVTKTAWTRINSELAKCVAAGICPDDALAEAQVAGWRGFQYEWIANRKRSQSPARQSGPDFSDTSWANDMGDGL